MSIDPANLMSSIYSFFSSLYPSTAGGQAFLAFEPLGLPMSDDMFKLDPSDAALSPPLAVERLSEVANHVSVQSGAITNAITTVDGMVSLFLTTSMPVNSDAMVPLGAAKQAASSSFDTTLGSMDGVPNDRFHPVYASPVNWYDPSAGANWTLHTVGEQQTQGTAPSPPPPPAVLNKPLWRVLPTNLQPDLGHAITLEHPLLPVAGFTRAVVTPRPFLVHSQMMERSDVAMPARAAIAARPAAFFPTSVAVVTTATAPSLPVTAMPVRMIQPLGLTAAVATLNANTTPQPITSNSIDISFEHCIVTLDRPWFPDTFLMLRNWYLPEYAKGEFSNNTGAQDPGLMPALATGFVAVRNLKISSQWSAQDATVVQGAASFGPFSLLGRSYDSGSGTLSCAGMQIIGWFCAALPVLPPAADPGLAVSPPAPATAGTGAAGSPFPTGSGDTSSGNTPSPDGSTTVAGSS